jgi:hypothetical protein
VTLFVSFLLLMLPATFGGKPRGELPPAKESGGRSQLAACVDQTGIIRWSTSIPANATAPLEWPTRGAVRFCVPGGEQVAQPVTRFNQPSLRKKERNEGWLNLYIWAESPERIDL